MADPPHLQAFRSARGTSAPALLAAVAVSRLSRRELRHYIKHVAVTFDGNRASSRSPAAAVAVRRRLKCQPIVRSDVDRHHRRAASKRPAEVSH